MSYSEWNTDDLEFEVALIRDEEAEGKRSPEEHIELVAPMLLELLKRGRNPWPTPEGQNEGYQANQTLRKEFGDGRG